ncbi:MAG: ABC transporter permease, partial [Rhizobiales bacterium]|nr:ABC transporter permease [Hyphomicrobiales bacterium]
MSASTLSAGRLRPGDLFARHAMLIAAIVLAIAFIVTSPVFGSPGNAANILRQSASVLVLGLAMTLVVLVGGIDLSVGSVVLASSTFSGIALTLGWPPAIAVLCGILVGAAVGLVNAILVEALRISPVIVTLGTMIAVRGLALIALGAFNSWVEIKGPIFSDLARRTVFGIPLDALVAILAAIVIGFVLKRTVLGRAWHAIGDAPVASRIAGLPVRRLRGLAYVGCGALSGLAGVLVAARTGLISPSIGQGLEFFAIAVVALGSGGLPAGRVSALNAAVGTLILMMIFNYMTIRGVPGTWQTTVTGFLLLLAMVGGGLLTRGSGEVASAEPFRDEYADMSPAGARLARGAVAGAAVLLALVFALVNPRFATIPNAIALIEQNGTLAIIAVGAMIGIVSRTVDISPGSVVALGAVVAALAF